jgi:hypothetical protein
MRMVPVDSGDPSALPPEASAAVANIDRLRRDLCAIGRDAVLKPSDAEGVLGLLSAFTDVAAVALVTWSLVSSVCVSCNTAACQAVFATRAWLAALETSLTRHVDNIDVVMHGLLAVRGVFFGGGAAGDVAAVVGKSLLPAVATSLRRHMANRAVAEHGCAVLQDVAGRTLSAVDARVIAGCARCGLADVCLDALRSHSDAAATQAAAAAALRIMALNSVALCERIDASGCVDALVAALHAHKASLQVAHHCVGLLCALGSCDATVRALLTPSRDDRLQTVLRATLHHRGDAAVAECGTGLLVKLGLNKESRTQLASGGAVTALVLLLRSQPSVQAVVRNALVALLPLVSLAGDTVTAMCDSKGLSAIVAAAKRFSGVESLVEPSCSLLAGVCRASYDVRSPALDAGCVPVLVTALQLYPSNHTIALHACQSLQMVATEPRGPDAVVNAGAVDVMVPVMRRYGTDYDVQHATLQCIMHLSTQPQLRRRIVTGRALTPVLAALTRFGLDEALMEFGLAILWQLACDATLVRGLNALDVKHMAFGAMGTMPRSQSIRILAEQLLTALGVPPEARIPMGPMTATTTTR